MFARLRPIAHRGVWALFALLACAPAGLAQDEVLRSALAPVFENEERVEIRATRLAIEEDLCRRFLAARMAGQSAIVLSTERFLRACDEHLDGVGNVKPLPHSSWAESKDAAVELGLNYLILIEISAGTTIPAGTPVTISYQVFRTKGRETVVSNRIAANTADLGGGIRSLAGKIGFEVGYTSGPQLEEALNTSPTTSSEAYGAYWLGRACLSLGQFDAAEERFARAAQLDEKFADARLQVGMVHLARARQAKTDGEWAAALGSADKAMAIFDPLQAYGPLGDALLVRADAFRAQGKRDDAWRATKTAAYMRMQSGALDAGYAIALQVRTEQEAAGVPRDVDVSWLLGHGHLVRQGEWITLADGSQIAAGYRDAEIFLNEALESDPQYAPALLDRGTVYLEWGRKYDPGGDEAQRVWRGNWLNAALDDFSKLTTAQPKNPVAFEKSADCLLAMAELPDKPTKPQQDQSITLLHQSAASYLRAISIIQESALPDTSGAMGRLLLRLGVTYRRSGDLAYALDRLQQSQQALGVDDPQPWFEIVLVYIDDHDFDGARKAQQEAMASVPFAPPRLAAMAAQIDAAERQWEASNQGFVPHRLPRGSRWGSD